MSARLIACVLVLTLLTGCALPADMQQDTDVVEVPIECTPESALAVEIAPIFDPHTAITCMQYDDALVQAQLENAAPITGTENVVGALVPHYAPAMYMVANVLTSVTDPPDTVVIVAPNHEAKGASVQICGNGYTWSSGTLAGDPDAAETLAAALGMETDDTAAQTDWSASLIVPYVAHFFPETRVVTVLVTRGMGEHVVRALADAITALGEEQHILMLGSADFSHEQDDRTARDCDKVTQEAIENGEISRLLTLSNAYVDSPETVAILLLYAAQLDRALTYADGRFENFMHNGKPTAGSYYSYLIT